MSTATKEPTTTTTHADRLLLTEREACEVMRICRMSLYRLRRRKDDPLLSIRVGGRILYPRQELERWVARRIRESARLARAGGGR